MKQLKVFAIILSISFLTNCKNNEMSEKERNMSYRSIEQPIAKEVADTLLEHGNIRIDNYFWMRLSDSQKSFEEPDAQTKDVLDYLNAENTYTQKAMTHTDSLQEKLYNEITSRIKKDDESIPYDYNGYTYYSRFEKGADYALYCRKRIGTENEEIYINAPELAAGKAYFGLGSSTFSPNNEILAYAVDTISRRQYTTYFKNVKHHKLLTDKLDNTSGSFVWANDNKTLFYITKDPQTLRNNKIYKHVLGTSQSDDELVYEEKDETFNCFITKSKSNDYLFVYSSQTVSTEVRFLDANTPNADWQIIQPRERNLEYSVDHYDDHFYIRTNHNNAENFKLVKTQLNNTTKEYWIDVIPHRDEVFLQGFNLFKDYLVLSERKDGLRTLRVIRWDESDDHYIKFNDPAYATYSSINLDFDTDVFRYYYTSLTTPGTTYDYNMKIKSQDLLKQEEVIGDFDSNNYESKRFFVTARDGVNVPVSLVHKKGLDINKNTPVLLYAYGSYGSSRDPSFSISRLSLLDRGFVYAIAHVRGGQEMGYNWYKNGKLLNKKNTFTDFIDVGKHLIDENYTSSDHLYAYGGSAGGLLMGAIVNMEPQLWNGVIAAVPFVDVVSTMWDESIPLTTFEFDEWGNPKDKTYYNYILSYSPYDNVEAKDYPNLLVTTGYWDSQVQYWEPAKWVAKLRAFKTDNNLLILDCDMESGHGGASGRFKSYKKTALNYAFLLDLEGITE
ncbi:S9 family peptidase [uncultured Winogradskyella sp.]|uniref:S9 family peptidase n=1 Tax=uncultured Winogradskyella sp. TaxID=395353 RepID=UPI00260ABC37|nr:S9 family peptidase [uncultured Winogradskyella sp.]